MSQLKRVDRRMRRARPSGSRQEIESAESACHADFEGRFWLDLQAKVIDPHSLGLRDARKCLNLMRLFVQTDLRFTAIERPQQIQIWLTQSIKSRDVTLLRSRTEPAQCIPNFG